MVQLKNMMYGYITKMFEIKMKCMICKHGETKQGTATVTLEKGNSTIVFKEVPANCAETYIDKATTKELLSKAREIAKHGVEVDIRKYEIAA